ncbi:MAG: DsbA family protein [Proteobacteria bacterium]|nr:DsbA family protein [Pseudomonadota bacterium]
MLKGLDLATLARDDASGVGRRNLLWVAAALAVLGSSEANAQQQSAPKMLSAPTASERAALADLISADLLEDTASPVLGDAQGDISIVEFFDYRCPYCKVMAPKLVELIGRDPRIRLVMKEYPILSRESIIASKVALVAARHGAYASFHAAMFALQGPIDEARIFQTAQSVGLDPAMVRQEKDGPEVLAELRRNLVLGNLIGVRGTPTFLVNQEMVTGAVSLDILEKLVQEARKGTGQ